MKVTKTENRF